MSERSVFVEVKVRGELGRALQTLADAGVRRHGLVPTLDFIRIVHLNFRANAAERAMSRFVAQIASRSSPRVPTNGK